MCSKILQWTLQCIDTGNEPLFDKQAAGLEHGHTPGTVLSARASVLAARPWVGSRTGAVWQLGHHSPSFNWHGLESLNHLHPRTSVWPSTTPGMVQAGQHVLSSGISQHGPPAGPMVPQVPAAWSCLDAGGSPWLIYLAKEAGDLHG